MKLYKPEVYFNDIDLLCRKYRVGINLRSMSGIKKYFFEFRKVSEKEMEEINRYVKESGCSIFSSPYDMYGFDGDYIDYLRLINDKEKHEAFFAFGDEEDVVDNVSTQTNDYDDLPF